MVQKLWVGDGTKSAKYRYKVLHKSGVSELDTGLNQFSVEQMLISVKELSSRIDLNQSDTLRDGMEQLNTVLKKFRHLVSSQQK